MKVMYFGSTENGFLHRLAHIECVNEYKQARARLNKTTFCDCVVYADNNCIDVHITDKADFNDFMYEWKKTR